jgi:integrase
VFRSPEGCAWPRHSVNINRMLRRLLEAAEIDRIDPQGRKFDVHACRHSLASRLARAEVPITHAQKLLGHSTVEMPARIYTHLGEEQMREAIDRIAIATSLHPRPWLVLPRRSIPTHVHEFS